jgi:hypothetical protein
MHDLVCISATDYVLDVIRFCHAVAVLRSNAKCARTSRVSAQDSDGVRLKHRSPEFCELLALLDEQTPADLPIHLILDPVSSRVWIDRNVDGEESASETAFSSPRQVDMALVAAFEEAAG